MRRGLVLVALLLACHATTTRPLFEPVTGASQAAIELRVPAATRLLADRLIADSIPVTKVEPRDGFLKTPWFDTASGHPTNRRRLGPGVVRLRAWVDPLQPGYSQLTVETLFRPLADPSLPERELDRQVSPTHPTANKVQNVLDSLTREYGDSAATKP